MELLNYLHQLHFIRPLWLLALIPAGALIWLYSITQIKSRSWASVIDPRLLPHLLKGKTSSLKQKNNTLSSILLFTLASFIILALAGPAFEKHPQPVFKTQSALVILLDLSRSMDAGDVKPSRLSRAHFKIDDILKQRKEGQTALIVYAANAYTVSPLTDDASTIAAQIPALETSIMPAQGSRLDIALDKAVELFNNAGHSKGDIFILSDGSRESDIAKVAELNANGFSSSVLAIGTQQGAPISAQGGGFVKDKSGSIVVPKLDIELMRKLALAGGGKFSQLTADDIDINQLLGKIDFKNTSIEDNEPLDASGNKFKTDLWHEEGPWLLLLVIPFAAYAFRRGLIFLLLLFVLPLPQPAQAFDLNRQWTELWNNKDQQAHAELQQGNAEKAASLFNNPEWKAVAEYKAENYAEAIDHLNTIDTAEANYNRGNALAKAGQYEEAIEAYNRALELQPENEDAKYNKELVEKAKQKQQQQKSQDQKNKDNQDKQDQQQDQQSQQGDSQNKKDGSQQQNKQAEQNNQSASDAEKDKQGTPQQSKDQQAEQDKKAQEKAAAEKQAAEDKQNEQNKDNSAGMQQPEDNSNELDLKQQQTQQWLKKIPDDPGGLLRRKFQYQYSRENRQNEQQPW